MSAPLKNRSGGDTILRREDLVHSIEFTTVADMIEQEIKDTLEARPDWKREDKFVQDVVTRAQEFYGAHQPGDELWLFKVGGATNMRLGLVLIRNDVVQTAWIRAMT